jgi:hypothetical protein
MMFINYFFKICNVCFLVCDHHTLIILEYSNLSFQKRHIDTFYWIY